AQEANSGMAVEEERTGGALGPSFWEQEGLTGDWGGARTSLGDQGITPFATFTGEFLGNVDGGYQDGDIGAGLLDFGLEMDLGPTLGLAGTTFFLNAFYFDGKDISEDVGDFNAVSNIYTDTEFNIFNIYLQQELAEGEWVLKLGQIAVDDDFMVSDTASIFVNSVFGPTPVESGNIAAPIYPLAAPGALVQSNPTEDLYIQGGVYAGDAGPNESDNHGFDWRTGGSAGWAFFLETGLSYEAAGEGILKVGGFYASSEFEDFSAGGTERGLSGFYALIDHRLLDASEDVVGMSVFLRGSFTPDESLATVGSAIEAGLQLSELFMGGDAMGFGFAYTDFSDDYLSAARGAGEKVTSSETVLELTYQALLTNWFAIQPDLQYIIDPHFSGENALVLGVRAELLF
ncbi:MAG: carbohydrate porin, partial [Puniceicoccales bacterium]